MADRDSLNQSVCGGRATLEGFLARVREAYKGLFASQQGQRTLVIAHAGTIRAVIGHVRRAEPDRWYRIRVDNPSFTGIRRSRHGERLEFHNGSLAHP